MAVSFYSTREPFGEFSNFSRHGVEMNGQWWPTTEHYFQAQKFEDPAYREKIRTTSSAKQAATLGRSRAVPLREDWESVKEDVMYQAIRAKFQTHPALKALLLSTGTEEIVENAPGDYYWGCGKDGSGTNRLGHILMRVREELAAQDEPSQVPADQELALSVAAPLDSTKVDTNDILLLYSGNNAEVTRYSEIQRIRQNAPMYIGGRDFFGFINYLVSAFDLLLDCRASWIEIEVTEDIRLSSDAQIPLRVNADGLLEPFEAYGNLKYRQAPDGTILTALSERFALTMTNNQIETQLEYLSGNRQSFHQRPATEVQSSVQIAFSPDDTIFRVWEVSPAVLHSYCRRTSCLHPGVSFRIKANDEIIEYSSQNGIRDFFTAISTPYQILHQPIHIAESDDELKVEAIFVFQSWTDNRIWSFANKGRVPDGGTHEAGMLDAIALLHNETRSIANTGVLAVLAIEYPHVTYEGCIKARIGNPELREKVAALVSQGLRKWIDENDDEVEYLHTIERFQFADSW